jgi:L-threonylcarbamoyladenylate synthase
MMDKHYAPRASLVLVRHADADAISRAVAALEAEGMTVGSLVLTDAAAGKYRVFMPREPSAYAARLYETLHGLDDAGCDAIVVERVPGGEEWEGIRDRLERAAR